MVTEIPGPNRKISSNKPASTGKDTEANDVFKQKQLRVTYQPDDEDLYGSAEDFDDSDLPVPPLNPNVYYGEGNSAIDIKSGNTIHNLGHKHSTHKPTLVGLSQRPENGGFTSSASNNKHHHHHYNSASASNVNGGGVLRIESQEDELTNNGGMPSHLNSATNNANIVTRKPSFYGKTDIRSSGGGLNIVGGGGSTSGISDSDNNNELSTTAGAGRHSPVITIAAAQIAAVIWCWHWRLCWLWSEKYAIKALPQQLLQQQFFIVSISLSSLITPSTWLLFQCQDFSICLNNRITIRTVTTTVIASKNVSLVL